MNIKVPSSVFLLTNNILPYLIPNIAAVVSHIIDNIIDRITISLEKTTDIKVKLIIIYVALIKDNSSYDRITYEKKNFINELNIDKVFLNISINNNSNVKMEIRITN